MMVSLVFLYPKLLFLLLIIPFFIFVYFLSITYNKKNAMIFANFEAMERFYEVEFFSKNFLYLYLNLIILVLLIFSVAGTSIIFDADTSAFSYVVAIDVSGSMAAADFYPTRLDAAKSSAISFIDALPTGVETGVIGFSGDVVVAHTPDSSKLKSKMAIESLSYGQVQGTNIYNALIFANQLFGSRKMKSIVLISDGQLNVGDAPQIIGFANRNNLMINTVAIGTREGGTLEEGIVSRVDEDLLKSLAFNTGGNFFFAEDLDSLRESFELLIVRTNKEITLDISFYLLIAAIILFTLMWVLHNFRFKVLPI